MSGCLRILKFLVWAAALFLIVFVALCFMRLRSLQKRRGRRRPPKHVVTSEDSRLARPKSVKRRSAHYWGDFEDDEKAALHWEPYRTLGIPRVRGKLFGDFGQEEAMLTLTGLPAHRAVRLSMEFFTIRSWDGESRDYGPDVMQVRVAGGPRLLRSTFTTSRAGQSYPLPFPLGRFDGGTGGDSLRFPSVTAAGFGKWQQHYRYPLTFIFPHTGAELRIQFAPEGLSAVHDEAWALDNVGVELLDAVPVQSVSGSDIDRAIQALASRDNWTAYGAMERLIAAGDAAVPAIASALDWGPEPAVRADLDTVAPVFDFDDCNQWRDVLSICGEIGPRTEPFVAAHVDRRRAAGTLPGWYAEVRDLKGRNTPAAARLLQETRAAWVLERIWSAQARDLLFIGTEEGE